MGLMLCFIGFVLINLLKTARLQHATLFSTKPAMKELFGVVCVYNLLTTVIPAGLGELSYPPLLKARQKASLVSGFSAVFVTRLLDVVTVIVFGLLALAIAAPLSVWNSLRWWMVVFALVAIVGAVILLKLIFSNVAGRFLTHLQSIPILQQVGGAGKRLLMAIASSVTPEKIAPVLLFTLGIWLGSYIMC
jgi:hypothetical protein